MQQLDNNLVDFWWDDISQKLSRCNSNDQDITPEILKILILQNHLIAFTNADCVIFGYYGYESQKFFHISYVEGKNLKEAMSELYVILRRSGCFSITQYSLKSRNRLYRKICGLTQQKLQQELHNYCFDLLSFNYICFEKEIAVLNPEHIDSWFPMVCIALRGTNIDIINLKFQALTNTLKCYRVGELIIIGRMVIRSARKEYEILAIVGRHAMQSLQCFMYYLESMERCRYLVINCETKYASLIDKITKGAHGVKGRMFSNYLI